jgi:phage terminase large subunit
MTEVVIRIPAKLHEVFRGRADVRGAYGGRGSAKTRSFAKMAAFQGMRFGQAGVVGQIVCGRQYMNSLADSSLEEVKRAIEEEPVLTAYYDVGEKYIKSHDGNISFAFVGLHHNLQSIKSKGRILLLWVDEAEPVTESAWQIVIPTLREEDEDWNAELWVTWNPLRKNAAVETRFRKSKDPLVKIAEMNWRDNPKFPAKLERERLRDLEDNPDQYDHIWEGGYATVISGAYYAKQLAAAKAEGRVGHVAAEELLTFRAHIDIGGTGENADNFVIWINQWVGRQILLLDYYEQQGQPAAAHINWLRSKGYTKDNTTVVLPHDGKKHDAVYAVTYQGAFQDAGYTTIVIPNMGRGAAMMRVEAARRVFPKMWFNDGPTAPGREALGWYHEKKDEKRGIGLGPDHDWSSHGADGFGLIAVDYELHPPSGKRPKNDAEPEWKRRLRAKGAGRRNAMTA